MNAPVQTSQRRAILATRVERAEEHVATHRQRLEKADDTGQNDETLRSIKRTLVEATETLREVRAQLAHFDGRDHQQMEAEIVRLRGESSAESIAVALAPAQAAGIASAVARLDAWVQVRQIEAVFRERLATAKRLENDLMSESGAVDFPRQAGFSLFGANLVPIDAVIAELERLASNAGAGALHEALKRDERGHLLVLGTPVRQAISMAGI